MSDPAVCPYCRVPFDSPEAPAKIYCTACGMPHHEDCYMENGGCTVFGCTRAPADDPKLQVSYSDLNAAMAPQPTAPVQPQIEVAPLPPVPSPYGGPLGLSQPAPAPVTTPSNAPVLAPPPPGRNMNVAAPPAWSPNPQPEQVAAGPPKSRTTFIVLGIFLGMLGVHNFYAGYTGKAVGQLCLSVLTLGVLAVASWVWAIIEICIVEKDGGGIQFS
jgi:TM2 domain-containing membrane protein YozV